jgi:hypothetical protein
MRAALGLGHNRQVYPSKGPEEKVPLARQLDLWFFAPSRPFGNSPPGIRPGNGRRPTSGSSVGWVPANQYGSGKLCSPCSQGYVANPRAGSGSRR